MNRLARHVRDSVRWQALLVFAVALCVHWPGLGSSGLSDSEGMRAIPAWEMQSADEWLVPSLFGQPYLRKPPAIFWAIGLASRVFGQSEFSARSVSAAAMTFAALLSFLFATRWFGRPWGLYAGLAFTLTPWFWRWGRSAEIEALYASLVLAALLLVTELAVAGHRARAVRAALALAAGLAMAAMLLTKGPAGLVCVASVPLAAGFLSPPRRPWREPWLWAAFALALALFLLWLGVLRHQVQVRDLHPVVEPPSKFLWQPGRWFQTLALGPITLASALPYSLALPLALLRRARPEANPDDSRAERVGRTLAWSVLISLLLLTLAGVSNNRYALPTVVALPCVLAFTLRRHAQAGESPGARWGRLLLLHRQGLVAILLLAMALGHAAWFEVRRADRTSGKAAGIALGNALDDGELWADALADNRPEVLWYARQRAAQRRKRIDVRWVPNMAARGLAPEGGYIAVLEGRSNDLTEPPEWPGLEESEGLGAHLVMRGSAHVFDFAVYKCGR